MIVPQLIFERVEGGYAPIKKHGTDSCYDLFARKVIINRSGKIEVYLGVKVQPPPGYDVRLYARSSLSKTSYVLGNSMGIIDQDYRGELMAIFTAIPHPAFGYDNFPYKVGDRVIQMEMRRKLEYDLVEGTVDDTARGEGGFGSTGV